MNHKLQMQLQCPMPQLDFEVITLGHRFVAKIYSNR
jgi:hypothetical protein